MSETQAELPAEQSPPGSPKDEEENLAITSILGFRDRVLNRSTLHGQALIGAYQEGVAQFRKTISDGQQKMSDDMERFREEALKELDEKLKSLRSDVAHVTNDVSRIKADVKQSADGLKKSLDEWEEQHKRTFQALDRFQKEYRDTIEQFAKATERMEEIVHGSRNLSTVSVLSVFMASALGSALVLLLLH